MPRVSLMKRMNMLSMRNMNSVNTMKKTVKMKISTMKLKNIWSKNAPSQRLKEKLKIERIVALMVLKKNMNPKSMNMISD